MMGETKKVYDGSLPARTDLFTLTYCKTLGGGRHFNLFLVPSARLQNENGSNVCLGEMSQGVTIACVR